MLKLDNSVTVLQVDTQNYKPVQGSSTAVNLKEICSWQHAITACVWSQWEMCLSFCCVSRNCFVFTKDV